MADATTGTAGSALGSAKAAPRRKGTARNGDAGKPPRDRAADKRRQQLRVRVITGAALAVLVAAWLYGYFNSGTEIAPRVPHVLPGAIQVEQQGEFFAGYGEQSGSAQLIGYAGVSEAVGYAGPIQLLVGVNPAGEILGVEVVEHRETPGFFRLLPDNDYFHQFLGLSYADPLMPGQDVDAVSGATISSEAVAKAIRDETRSLGAGVIGAELPPSNEPFHFGAPEVLLIGLYVAGYFGHRSRHREAKKWIRRATLFIGAVGLGFLYNKPLTAANLVSLMSGYWPDWHTNLYWFLLLGGILFVTTAQGKNPYCSWFCPFGAVQEGLGRIGGAKLYRPRKWHHPLVWLQRSLSFGAIVLGLALRQPGAVSYEPFGTLFDFTGSSFQWFMLGLVVLASLLIYRPFCTYLCPISPVVDYVGEVRRMGKQFVRKVRA